MEDETHLKILRYENILYFEILLGNNYSALYKKLFLVYNNKKEN